VAEKGDHRGRRADLASEGSRVGVGGGRPNEPGEPKWNVLSKSGVGTAGKEALATFAWIGPAIGSEQGVFG